MLLTHHEIIDLLDRGVVTNTSHAHVNAASLDVHLSRRFLIEAEPMTPPVVMLANRESPVFMQHDLDVLWMAPCEFVLASTVEVFNLPNDVAALFVMKSSLARAGLNQNNAAWCSPGWSGSTLTLELRNDTRFHTLALSAGMAIGQMVFFRGTEVPSHLSYSARGTYQGDLFASAAKPNKPETLA